MRVRILFVLITAFVLTSCEKVIDIALNDSEKRYVIEGVLTDHAGDCAVRVSKTQSFSNSNDFEGVTGAEVSITDHNGNAATLTDIAATGVYRSGTLTAATGRFYTLRVAIDGAVFTASCTMPAMVNMDSLYMQEERFFGETVQLANVTFSDPPGKGNSYRFVQYVNGLKERNIFIRDDDYSDGKASVVTLFIAPDDDGDEIKSGDTVKVEMLCIAPEIYKYWYSLDQGASGYSNSASPANPVSNMEGGALGYFSVHTVQSKTVVVP